MAGPTLTFLQSEADKLEPHLPPPPSTTPTPATNSQLPFVTLTFATSLDSALSLAPGTRTTLSGPQSKAMTHYLRSRHAAICIGVGTAVADDPGLNCRIAGAQHQPRPVIIDPRLRWRFTGESKVMRLARAGEGLAPFIVTGRGDDVPPGQRALLEGAGGKYVFVSMGEGGRFRWEDVLRAVGAEGLGSIMVEGGAEVINSLLEPSSAGLVDSVVLTIAPTWLGRGSVVVSPARRLGRDGQAVAAARLTDTLWIPLGEDVVLVGKIAKEGL